MCIRDSAAAVAEICIFTGLGLHQQIAPQHHGGLFPGQGIAGRSRVAAGALEIAGIVTDGDILGVPGPVAHIAKGDRSCV